jgi:4'-phosphopantetheinyl transferase EntD
LIDLDSTHVALSMLRTILPEAFVAGGSFAAHLPPPATLAPAARRTEYERVRHMAVEECLAMVVSAADLPAGTVIHHAQEGDRRWPHGFVGSVTDKATVVAAALAERTVVDLLGIDIERADRGGRALDESFIGTGIGPPGFDRTLATLITFSAKEAAFKAQFAATRRQLGYLDIEIDWPSIAADELHARARCRGLEVPLSLRCAVAAPWVTTVALAGVAPA